MKKEYLWKLSCLFVGDNADFTYQLDDKSGAFTLDSRSGWLTVSTYFKTYFILPYMQTWQ